MLILTTDNYSMTWIHIDIPRDWKNTSKYILCSKIEVKTILLRIYIWEIIIFKTKLFLDYFFRMYNPR